MDVEPAFPAHSERAELMQGAADVVDVRAAGQFVDRGAVAVADQVTLAAGFAADHLGQRQVEDSACRVAGNRASSGQRLRTLSYDADLRCCR